MESFGAFNLIGLIVLGVATLVATSLVYGPSRRASTDVLRRMLATAGWFLIVSGVIGGLVGVLHILAIPVLLILAFVLAMSIRLFRRQEHSLRLWQIAIAAERGVSLVDTLRAMGQEQTPISAWKPRTQAELLASGHTLAQALADTYDTPARGPALAVGAAADWGNFAPALREALRCDEEFELTLREEIGRLFYIFVILLQSLLVLAFILVKIVPVFQQMLSEFDIEYDAAGNELTFLSEWIADRWWLLLPLLPFVFVFLVAGLLHFLSLWPRRLPGLSWFTGATDRAWVMRGIAWGVHEKRPIPEVLASLARHFDVARVRWKLDEALVYVRQGIPWIDGLHRAGLLRASDAAVLRAAERSGNVEWALREQAASSSRSWGTGLKRGLTIAFPLAMIGIGLVVGRIGWFFFSVLSLLIEKLA